MVPVTKKACLIAALLMLTFAAGVLVAQQQFGRGGTGGTRVRDGSNPPELTDRRGIPDWEVDPHFKSDLFTFVRVHWHSWRSGSDVWLTDYPDSDLNFPFRLQQMTSIKADPTPKQLELTDDELFDYPFIYMLEVSSLEFTDEEAAALRRYLLNGGFLMVDDFWGEYAWHNFEQQMKKVFPDRESVDLPIEHPIFHCVFDLKEKPQVPGIDTAREMRAAGTPEITWERRDAKDVHYRAFFDDKGRMMAMICQNTDLGDGWEREGEEEWYFHEFSEKKAYPMGINIVFWAMTH
jgi:hypothetical protein